jgi:hypothetical protein
MSIYATPKKSARAAAARPAGKHDSQQQPGQQLASRDVGAAGALAWQQQGCA